MRSPVYYTPIWGRLLEPNISRNQSHLITDPFVRVRFWRKIIIYVLIVPWYLLTTRSYKLNMPTWFHPVQTFFFKHAVLFFCKLVYWAVLYHRKPFLLSHYEFILKRINETGIFSRNRQHECLKKVSHSITQILFRKCFQTLIVFCACATVKGTESRRKEQGRRREYVVRSYIKIRQS